jgi:isopenicillin-N N-acyltransferase-like protein
MRRRADVALLGDSKVLYLSGTPYQQGKQLGQGAAEEIRENMRRAIEFRDRVAAGHDQADYHALTRKNERWVGTVYPELLDELSGIAEGANVDYGELLSMNLNTHISHIYSATLACTQVLATGAATADGKTYIGKTRDLAKGPLLAVLLQRAYDDGTFINEVHTAGRMTIPDGVNQYGVAVTCSGQWSPRVKVDLSRADSAWMTLNLQIALRQARTTSEAIELLREQPRACGMQVLVADGSRAAALEVTDDELHVFEPEDGLLTRTNHYFSPALAHLKPTVEENHGTYDRYARATEIMQERRGVIGMPDLLRVLSDHAEPPRESICRHGDGNPEGRTIAATFVCPEDRLVWTTLGPPCLGIQAVGAPGA